MPTPHSKSTSAFILSLYRESVKKIPILKFSWVLISTICILSISAYLKLKNGDVFFYAIGVLIISFLAFVFSLMLKIKDVVIKIAVYIIVYCIIITMSVAVLGFASFIIQEKPSFYKRWFPAEADKKEVLTQKSSDSIPIKKDTPINNKAIVHPKQTKTNLTCAGRVIDAETDKTLGNVKILVDGSAYYTDSYGNFSFDINALNPEVIIKLFISKSDYQSINKMVRLPNDRLTIQLSKIEEQ
ncbi:hypothetical protein A4D02_34220 [Niastella koreensis]|uniref:Uncharacterized protein n=2 Tax=Niastella koreensis TaxID=354356 RepID=G8TDD3_NIAKG|nr:hypothetical protein [Niastella koreensis]AEV99373.1 hypothetical protein Niako_3043 [Niastella koreensis GR20-10]OQP45227.1 hypothetical protein A4D02_34220 [Niastella koreensis]